MQPNETAIQTHQSNTDRSVQSEYESHTANTGVTKPVAMNMLTPSDIIHRRDAIIQVMKGVMKEGVHYGKPFKGSDKDVLLQPGAQVLLVTFQMSSSMERKTVDLGDGHREYIVNTKIHHIPSGSYICEGMGSCSTLESKYRYRMRDDATEVPVPKEAWDLKNSGKMKDMKALLRKTLDENEVEYGANSDIGFVKTSGGWFISIKEKAENPDIADTYNTVLKMACKRSLVHAAITATASSDLWTQDIEEMSYFQDDIPHQTDERDQTHTQPRTKKEKAIQSEYETRQSISDILNDEVMPLEFTRRAHDFLEQDQDSETIQAMYRMCVSVQKASFLIKDAQDLGLEIPVEWVKLLNNTRSRSDVEALAKEVKAMIDKAVKD
jgi:hypothetical protein